MKTNTIFVVGHRNPDMDAVASAIGYAWFLNQIHSDVYMPAIAGDINKQTAFALQRFNVEKPPIINDVRPRVRDVFDESPALHGTPNIMQVCQHFTATRRAIPIVDEADQPQGMIISSKLLGYLTDAIVEPQSTILQKALTNSALELMDKNPLTLQDSEHITQVIQRVQHIEASDYIVVDTSGKYIGLCRKTSLLASPRQKLVLVDHNEAGQSVQGIEEAEVVEVLDHHRVDSITTILPIHFHIDPVGSCSTLVAEKYWKHRITVPDSLAGILLCGILSDTLIFQSPTTTERDREVAHELARSAKLAGDLEAVINALGQELLMAGAGLGIRSVDNIITSDLKYYEIRGNRIAISQVEVTDFEAFEARTLELQLGLKQLVDDQSLILALLMVTDVLRGDSRILALGDSSLVADLPFPRLADGTLKADGVVSRKKQLAPAIISAIQYI